VDDDGISDHLGWGKPNQRPIEWVEEGGLDVSDKRDPHEEIRVPKREIAGAQRLGGIGPIGIEISEDIQAHQDEIGESYLPKENQCQSP
jgi:hypothetical protein